MVLAIVQFRDECFAPVPLNSDRVGRCRAVLLKSAAINIKYISSISVNGLVSKKDLDDLPSYGSYETGDRKKAEVSFIFMKKIHLKYLTGDN